MTEPSVSVFPKTPGLLLQRACACGQHTIASGECEGCRKKHQELRRDAGSSELPNREPGGETVAHKVSPSKPLDTATRAVMKSSPGHDFSGMPVHSNPMQLMKSGADMRGEGAELELDDRPDVVTSAVVGGVAGAAGGASIGGQIMPGLGGAVGAVLGGIAGAIGGAISGVPCSASASGVALGASGPINDGTVYGLRTPINVWGTELADVLDSESVGASIDHTGSMVARPSATSNNSGFMAADSIPDDRHTSGIADHLSFFDQHGGDGSYSRLQMDLFKIPKCGINTPQPMPNSGYRVKRHVKAEGTSVVGIITKTAEAVTVGSNSSTPGITPKKEAKVTLRP